MAVPAVEDFPQTWERPPFADLVEALKSLELKPPIWNHKRKRDDILVEQESLASQKKSEVTRYLASIIKSPLSWLPDDEEKEELWTLASKRMSERCGRTAMGEVIRSWPFDGGDGPSAYEPFEMVIREPALTGDSLGFKTWGSSYVLAQELPRLQATSLFKLFDESLGQPQPRVLELGSGTGLLGIAAAALWKVSVSLTDLPNIVTNLKENAERNTQMVETKGGSLTVGPLTWGSTDEDEVDHDLFGEHFQFKVCCYYSFALLLCSSSFCFFVSVFLPLFLCSFLFSPYSQVACVACVAFELLLLAIAWRRGSHDLYSSRVSLFSPFPLVAASNNHESRLCLPLTLCTTTITRRFWRRQSRSTWRWGATLEP